jgi:pyruvate/2-oxoglutarate dehydrogenase complex dihydrolipoamide acyltransferase (E2) component
MEFCLPDLGEGIVQAEMVQWMVKPGDQVERGQNIAEVMTDKAAVELPSPFAGTIGQLLVEPGEPIDVGSVMAVLETSDVGAAVVATEQAQPTALPTTSTTQPLPRAVSIASASKSVAAPSVRRMARSLGIDLSTIQGSGPNNRVLIDDLSSAIDSARLAPAKQDTTNQDNGKGSTQARPSDRLIPGTRVPLLGLRRTIAQRMSHANETIPSFSYVDEVDVTDLVRIRESLKEPFAAKGIKLTYLPFFAKATIAALKEVPQVNASLDADANEIVLHDQYHLGIATDTPAGLLVPVLHDADQKSLQQIAAETKQLTTATREGKATLDQLQGSTFTITSTGGIGGLISTPIINEPNVGILGIGQIVKRPRFDDNGNIAAAHIVYLSLSFDHRVVDGADAARFANALIAGLMQPAALLLANSSS